MEKQLQVFFHPEFGELRILVIEGTEYFPATECAAKLGYANPRKAIRDHCKGGTKRSVPTSSGIQEMNFIPEGDLYRLIVRSNLPAAERFERWVFDEVLPSLRKSGSYSMGEYQIPQTLPEALRLAADLAEENEQLRPKAELHDRFLTAENVQTVSVVAKTLGTGRGRLFRFLREQKILMANNTPYQQYLERGYFRVREKVINMGGTEVVKPQTLVTAKGVNYIAKLLGKSA